MNDHSDGPTGPAGPTGHGGPTDDDGTPSDDAHADLLRVLALVEDERHLVAYDLYRDARNRVELLELASGVGAGAGGGGDAGANAMDSGTNNAMTREGGGGGRGTMMRRNSSSSLLAGTWGAGEEAAAAAAGERAPPLGGLEETVTEEEEDDDAGGAFGGLLLGLGPSNKPSLASALSGSALLRKSPPPPPNHNGDDTDDGQRQHRRRLLSKSYSAPGSPRVVPTTTGGGGRQRTAAPICAATSSSSREEEAESSKSEPLASSSFPPPGGASLSERGDRRIASTLPLPHGGSLSERGHAGAFGAYFGRGEDAGGGSAGPPAASDDDDRHNRRGGLRLDWWKLRPAINCSFTAERERNIRRKLEEDAASVERARTLLRLKSAEFESLEKRALLFQQAKENLTVDDDWTFSQTLFGVTTHYRREDDNSLSVKIEGGLVGVPLFEQLAVLRECDLYHLWSPFCVESRKLAQLGKIEVIGWFNVFVAMLGLSRDAAYRAMGCDTMREDGSIMLVAEGINPPPRKNDNEEARDDEEQVAAGAKDGSGGGTGGSFGGNGTRGGVDGGGKSPSSLSPSSPKRRRRVKFGSFKSGKVGGSRHDKSYRKSDTWSPGGCRNLNDSPTDPEFNGSVDMGKSWTAGDSGEGSGSGDLASSSNSGSHRLKRSNSVASMSSDKDNEVDEVEIPPVPTRFGSGRMMIRSFNAVIDVMSADSARTRIVANIDPNLRFIPQSLIDFFTKKICGVVLLRIQAAARKIIQDPVKNPHAKRIRQDAEFYRDWLMPKFKAYCDELGWDMPPVSAFEVDDEDLDMEDSRQSSQNHDVGSRPPSETDSVCSSGCGGSRSSPSKNPLKELRRKIDEGPEIITPIKSREAKLALAERKIERSRKKLKKQLRATPLDAEQRRRYEELQRTKRRLEEERIAEEERQRAAAAERSRQQRLNSAPSTDSTNTGDDSSTKSCIQLGRKKIPGYVKRFLHDLLTSPAWLLLAKLFVMFLVFFSESPVSGYVRLELRGWQGKAGALVLMVMYGAVHAYVVYSICIVAFDVIEPHIFYGPGGEKNGGRRGSIRRATVSMFRSGRKLFQTAARKYAVKFALAIILFSSLSSFLSVSYKKYRRKHEEFGIGNSPVDPSDDGECTEAGSLGLKNATVEMAYATAGIAFGAADMVGDTMTCPRSLDLWKIDALEMCKWIMANSAAFMTSLVIISIVLLSPYAKPAPQPQKGTRRHLGEKTVSWRHGLSDNSTEAEAAAGTDSSKLTSSQRLHRERMMKVRAFFQGVGNGEHRGALPARGIFRGGEADQSRRHFFRTSSNDLHLGLNGFFRGFAHSSIRSAAIDRDANTDNANTNADNNNVTHTTEEVASEPESPLRHVKSY